MGFPMVFLWFSYGFPVVFPAINLHLNHWAVDLAPAPGPARADEPFASRAAAPPWSCERSRAHGTRGERFEWENHHYVIYIYIHVLHIYIYIRIIICIYVYIYINYVCNYIMCIYIYI